MLATSGGDVKPCGKHLSEGLECATRIDQYLTSV
jgi:hypothetical protein